MHAHVWKLAVAALFGMAPGGPMAPPAGGGQILEVFVSRESEDEVELEIAYRLEPSAGEAFLSAITLFWESSTGYWSYRPARLRPGAHRAVVTVGMSGEAPSMYRSDAFLVRIYGSARAELTYPFEKLWCQAGSECDEARLEELGRAPLIERLTSMQPSIWIPAEVEAEGLDEDARRELLPGILEKVHHGERRVRLRALDVLRDWQLVDSTQSRVLIEAMSDPHPGISRVATSVLARLGEPEDPLVEDALTRAWTASDESTRRYAEEGLERLERLLQQARKPAVDVPPPESEKECLAAGGRWGFFGLYRVPECNLPTPDAGSPCRDAVDCVSACVADVPDLQFEWRGECASGPREGEPCRNVSDCADNVCLQIPIPVAGSGTCYGWSILRGTCLNHVEEGKIHPKLCVD